MTQNPSLVLYKTIIVLYETNELEKARLSASILPELGKVYTYARKFSRKDILEFAQLTGDLGSHHIDSSKRVIAQGLLVASIVTKIGGEMNYIAKSMEINISLPVFEDESILGQLEITRILTRPKRMKLEMDCKCFNSEGQIVLHGYSKGQVWLPN